MPNNTQSPEGPSHVVRGSWRCSPWWTLTRTKLAGASLLSILQVAHQHRLDLSTLLSAYADEHQWPYRSRLRLLAQRLSEGTPLETALEQTPGLLTHDQLLELRLGLKSGTYAETIQKLAHTELDPLDSTIQELTLRPMIYMISMLLGGGFLVAFISVFLLPTFQIMLTELEGDAVIQTAALRRIGIFQTIVDIVMSVWPILATLGIGSLIFVFVKPDWGRTSLFRFGRMLGRGTAGGTDLLRLLAIPLRRGRPLPGAISTLARYHYAPSSRSKLLLARNEIEHGVDVWSSLVDARLVSEPQVDAIRHCESPEVQSWVADQIAAAQSARETRNRIARLTFLHPLCVLVLGAVVMGIAYTILTALRDVMLGQL